MYQTQYIFYSSSTGNDKNKNNPRKDPAEGTVQISELGKVALDLQGSCAVLMTIALSSFIRPGK